ncbi:serine-threonine kinase receptor-associated protein [Fistulifera solaris]|uniref:Serine-threonine kinase receptor-associated protein n=1 Tax=Fistulifera solaris TaxID=1519565 RepID=A0A1Z5KMR3_FISSO|nr:serine-threonine kinase receptor-associated protein [Fistulifera solaris]|eukprot:GAX27352.1 serine-threonine kinase receptor-associated protein [Fistulifera solaris]
MGAEDTAEKNHPGRQIPIVCPGHTRPLAELQFIHVSGENRTLLISACHDKKPMVRDGITGDWIGTFVGHKGAVWCCRLDPSGNLAATASGDYSVHVWDAITGKDLHQLPHKHIVKTCDFTPNSRWLATGGHEGIIRVYDLLHPKNAALEIAQSSGPKIGINKCLWISNNVLLAGGTDGCIRFWQIDSLSSPGKLIHVLKTENGVEIRDMDITSTTASRQILSVAAGDKVYFFNLADRSLMHSYKMPVHFREEGGVSLHPSGEMFVAGGSDLWVRVFATATGQELECHKGHHGPIRCLRYSPDGSTYASGSEDGTIRIWKTHPD